MWFSLSGSFSEAAARRHPKGEKAVRRLPDRFRPEIEKKMGLNSLNSLKSA